MKIVYFALVLFAALNSIHCRTNKGHEKKDFCSSADPGHVVEKVNGCIINVTLKSAWLDCQQYVLKTSEPEAVAEAYCSQNAAGKKKIGDKFVQCIKDEGNSTWGDIMHEWDENCGFCTQKSMAVKLDKCISFGPERDALFKCRKEMFHTRDPMKAANAFCYADKVKQQQLLAQTFVCLKREHVTSASWNKATKHCDWYSDDMDM
ncbi:hypothetical protein HDE_04090 [Halotydeus destructor]|nr:hypothetical protein HDE_04090 [Halotydeus destructor]